MKRLPRIPFILTLLVASFVLYGCASKDDIFNDSRRCSLQPQDVTDVFGTVIKKASKGNECVPVQFDPCDPQYKFQEALGEVSEDTENSVVVCPTVKNSPVLPSDYTQDDTGAIDLSKALPNEDYKSVDEKEFVKRSNPESESPPVKEQTREFHPILTKDILKKQGDVSLQTVQKATPRSTSKSKANNPVRKISLGPFFKGKSYIPYAVKASFEEHIKQVQRKYPKVKKWKYAIIGRHLAKDKGALVMKRVNQLTQYAVWKMKIPEHCFSVKIQTTKNSSLVEYVDILVYIDR